MSDQPPAGMGGTQNGGVNGGMRRGQGGGMGAGADCRFFIRPVT